MLKEKPLGTNYGAWSVTQTLLGTILNVTQQRINQLTDDGVIVPTGNKNSSVFLIESLKNFYFNKYGGGDLKREKTLHERAKRELTEMEVAKRRGELLERAAVTNLLVEILTNFRNKLSGFGAKLSPQLEGKNRAEIFSILTAECDELLTDLAKDFERADFEDEEVETGTEGGDTADTKIVGQSMGE